MSKTSSRKDAAVSFLKLVTQGRVREAYDKYIDPRMIHHHPFCKGDAASLRAAMEEHEEQFPHKTFDVQHVLEDGDYVAVRSHLQFNGMDMAVCHLFRFAGDRVIEFWDMGQLMPPDSPNENGMF
jgi:predicted SnoaL-like aldol condensation-catalyzing enzyme